ncbi:MAG: redoxin domain-containing protein [Dehalococcoidia bacterium]
MAPWKTYGMRNWLTRVGLMALIVGAGLGIAYGLGIIGDDGTETVVREGETITISEAEVVDPPEAGDEGIDVGVEEGEVAPDFLASNFAGERFQLSDFRGKVVFLNFWASWCGPCRAEMPAMQDLLEQYGDDLVVIAINNQESYRPATGFIEELGVEFTQFGFDPTAQIVDVYKVFTMPTSYFIDANGRISDLHIGQITYEEMVEKLEEARQAAVAAP